MKGPPVKGGEEPRPRLPRARGCTPAGHPGPAAMEVATSPLPTSQSLPLWAGAGLCCCTTTFRPTPLLRLPLRGRGPLGGRLLGPLPALLLGVENDALGGGDVVGGHLDVE